MMDLFIRKIKFYDINSEYFLNKNMIYLVINSIFIECNMKFEYIDTNGIIISGECQSLQDTSKILSHLEKLRTIGTSIEAVIGEMEFYEKTFSKSLISVKKITVDNEGNVFDGDQFPDLTRLGNNWKIIE